MKAPTVTVSRGYNPGSLQSGEYILKTEEEWKSLFNQAFPGRSYDDHGSGYNFSTQTLIAVFLGESPLHSAVRIERVNEEKEGLEVVVSRNIHTAAEKTCNPYHIVRIPRTEGEVRFSYQDDPTLPVSDIRRC